MKKTMILAIASTLAFTACKKDDKDNGATKSEHLMKGSWQISAATLTFPLGEQDLLASMDDCQKDNLYIFNADKTITVDAGAVKCNASEQQQTTEGNWELTSNDSKLRIGGSSITQGFGNMEVEVLQLDANTIKIKKDTAMGTLSGAIMVTLSNKK